MTKLVRYLFVFVLVTTGCGGAAATPISDKAIMDSLQKSGLPVVSVQSFTSETDPNKLLGRPGQYTIKVNWKDSRAVGGLQGGDSTIEVYPELDAAKQRASSIEAIGKATPMLLQYVYVNEARRAVLRVPRDLTPDQAKAYQDWLAKL